MLSVFLLLPVLCAADIAQTMSYQGQLTDSSGNPVNGSKNLRFWIYDASSGGNILWSETQNAVPINNGIFNVILGTVYPVRLDMRNNLFLEIQVDHTGGGSWEIMSPRHALVCGAYALAAANVVNRQVLTVAHAGGDTTTVSRAIDRLLGQGAFSSQGALSPAPSNSTPWVIEVKAGMFLEPGTTGGSGRIVIPDYVTVRGQGWEATKIRTSSGFNLSIGTGRGLENLLITNANYTNVINMAGSNRCIVRDIKIESVQPDPAIIMTGAQYCEVIGNHIIGYGTGAARGIRIDSTSYCRIEDNYINISHPLLPSSATNSWGMLNSGTSLVGCVIAKNTIRYNTSGSGTTASYGIGLSGTGAIAAWVSHNIFQNGVTGKDIVSVSTWAPPAWTAPGNGEHGIGNQRSDGTQAPAF